MKSRLVTRTARVSLVLALIGSGACGGPPALELPPFLPLDVPAGPGAALPHLADDGERVILSWVEPGDSGHILEFARWDGSAWSEPRVVAAGTDWFVNWADFPSVVALGGDDLAAHWLQRSSAGTYSYDVMISRSGDGGSTWSDPVRPHSDGTPTEHGFVSLFAADAGLGVVWLDGRRFVDDEGGPATKEMALRFTTLGSADDGSAADGTDDALTSSELVLDERVCDCCQTAVALTGRGPLIAYRDRSPGEIRDISVVRRVDGTWSEPRTVHEDNWQIDACPVNGPQADAMDDDVVIAWFTAAGDTPIVRVAFSDDAGGTFGVPVRVDGGDPLGRVDALLLDGDRALVVWLERTADGAEVRARIVTRDGRAGEPALVARTLAQRPSGFPRMARYGGDVVIAWTEPGEVSRVRAATLNVSGGLR